MLGVLLLRHHHLGSYDRGLPLVLNKVIVLQALTDVGFYDSEMEASIKFLLFKNCF